MYPINMHIGEPKTAFTKILAAYVFLKMGFKVLNTAVTSLKMPKWYLITHIIFLLSINFKKEEMFYL